MAEHLGFAPEILRRLGEELAPHADQGIVELVRNAYDADATWCTVELSDPSTEPGRIVVTDNGRGLDQEAIRTGWLVVGRSRKTRSVRTQNNRVPAGDKGLGRLAGLRIGRVATLRSRPAAEPGVEYVVNLNWDEFDESTTVESVPIVVERNPTEEPPGTSIELTHLRSPFDRVKVTRLARSLILLSDPFDHEKGFKPSLLAPEFADLEELVSESYFDDVDYRIFAELDSDGRASASVLDWRGEVRFAVNHEGLQKSEEGAYETSPARFELWVFTLSGKNFSAKKSTLTEVRNWLRIVGGVHVYQHELRVPPYGDAGVDWLDMNLLRARSPEQRPSTNTSVGRVVVLAQDDLLIQKTDRSGFIENEAFGELRRFCRDVLDWSATELLRVSEDRRRRERETAERDFGDATVAAEVVRETLEQTDSNATLAFARYQKAIERQMAALREDVLLYRTLGTVGTTSAAFAHESVKPASRIEQGVKLTRSAGKRAFGDSFDGAVGRHLDKMASAAAAIGRWSQLPLRLLQRDKRRARNIDLGESISAVVDLLEPFMAEANIGLELDFADVEAPVFAPPAALESIVANLLVNAMRAVMLGSSGPRRIALSLSKDQEAMFATLVVADSGPGVTDMPIKEIWLPGRTSFKDGTGLGLTIVNDSVTDLGGSVKAANEGELSGAEFTVVLPLVKVDGP